MSDYNYRHFPQDLERDTFAAFRDVVKAGGRAPDGSLTELATTERVQLSDLWKQGPLVVEFGSFS
ncbi:MAG: hypothetical protein KTR31_28030 [Myxococcales bacterium]|nr:hypothetical protein [Myxococcales bacterium]